MEPQLTEALFASFIAKSGQLEIVPLSRCLKLNPCARPVGPYRTPPRTPIVITSQRVWAGKLCLCLWLHAGHVAKFECSQPVVLFSDS